MADLTKTVQIVFGGKNELTKTIGQIEREFAGLESVASNVTQPLANIGKGILAADAALAALAIGGMAASIKASGDFNSQFGLISTSVSATGKDLATFREDVLTYANSSTKSISDINGALYTAVQAGVDYKDSIGFIAKAEELAVANKANLNTTVDLLTGTMNAYGMKMEDVGRINDVYFTSTLIGKQTIDELGQSMGLVSGIAANAGVSFEDLQAGIATLTAKGLGTAEAITAMKAVITTIISPSKEAAEAAKNLGLNFSLTSLTSQGFAGFMNDLMVKTGGSKEKMAELFSEVRAMNGAFSLTGDGMKFFNEALAKINESAGSSAEAYKKMVDTFTNQTQMIKNQLTTLAIDVGTQLEPMALSVGKGFSDVIAGVKAGVDAGAFDPLFEYLKTVSTEFGAWLSGVGAALPEALSKIDFTVFIKALGDLRNAFGSYTSELDLTAPNDLAGVIQLIVNSVSGLVEITASMVEAFRPFLAQIGEFLVSMTNADEETTKTSGTLMALAMVVEKIGLGMTAAALFAQEYGVSIQSLFDIVTGGAQVMWNGMEILGNAIKGLVLIVEGSIVDMLDKLTFGMFPGLEKLKEDITKQGEEVSKAFAIDGEDAARGLEKFMAGFGTIGEAIGKGKESASALKQAIDDVGTSASNASPPVDSLYDELEELGKQVVSPKVSVAIDQKAKEDAIEVITIVAPAKKDVKITPTTDEKALKDQKDIMLKAMDIKAKVDIAEIEAASKAAVAMFSNLDTRVKSTAEVYETIVKGLSDPALHWSMKENLASMLKKESEYRETAMEQSAELTKQQIELNKLKIDALKSGSSEISVRADGLKPHLEMILWEVLEAIQIRASGAQAEFLLGFTG